MRTPLNPSPSRKYVIATYSIDFKSKSFIRFDLPENYENTCADATHYFYNVLDSFACGEDAYPIEMHNNVINV